MLETLQIDDRIIVNELVPDLIAVERGDVVVFKDPGGWLGPVSTQSDNPVVIVSDWFLSAFGITAPDSSQHLVKRVIGVGGDHIVCCDADGKLTGRLLGTPTQGPGKVTHTKAWLANMNKQLEDFERVHFYSDSHNDLPLMSIVSHPVATNPNAQLKQHASAHGWPLIDLFND